MPYSDIDDARDPAFIEEAYHEAAADIVAELAPAPDPLPVPDTYSPRAARAELMVFGWLKTTEGGGLTASSLSGVASESYAGMDVIQGIVARTMGSYYKSESSGSAVGVVGPAPW